MLAGLVLYGSVSKFLATVKHMQYFTTEGLPSPSPISCHSSFLPVLFSHPSCPSHDAVKGFGERGKLPSGLVQTPAVKHILR